MKAEAFSKAKRDAWKYNKEKERSAAQKEARQFNFDFSREGEYNPENVPAPPSRHLLIHTSQCGPGWNTAMRSSEP